MLDMLKKYLVVYATLDHAARRPGREKPKPNNHIGDKMRYKKSFKIVFANGTTSLVDAYNKKEAITFAKQFTDIKVVDAYIVDEQGRRLVPGGHFAKIAKKFGVKYYRGHLWSYNHEVMDDVIEHLRENGYDPKVIKKTDPVSKKTFVEALVPYMYH